MVGSVGVAATKTAPSKLNRLTECEHHTTSSVPTERVYLFADLLYKEVAGTF